MFVNSMPSAPIVWQSIPASTRYSRQSANSIRPLGSDVSASSARPGYTHRIAETAQLPAQ